MIDEQKIEENYNKFMEYVKADSRAEQLVAMYEDYGNELMTAPASGKSHYHNTFPGGYLDHVLRVVETTLQVASMYKKMGGTINFTKEEAVFSALHHDLGKLGNPGTAPIISTKILIGIVNGENFINTIQTFRICRYLTVR